MSNSRDDLYFDKRIIGSRITLRPRGLIMPEILKNIADGIGNVLLRIPSPGHYHKLPKNGFKADRKNLSRDFKALASDMRKSVEKASVYGKS